MPLALMTATAWSLVHGLSQLTIDGHLPNADAEPHLAEGITSLLLEGPSSPTPTPIPITTRTPHEQPTPSTLRVGRRYRANRLEALTPSSSVPALAV